MIALILVLLWEPALSLAHLKPQQNIIAVLVDDSQSMARQGRETQALAALRELLPQLQRRFQTRVYTFDANLHRATNLTAIAPHAPATLVGTSLDQLLQQTSDLPIGGVVLLSDGADNSGGLAPATIERLRSRQIPVQTVGFGNTTPAAGLEMEAVQLPARALAKARVQALVQFRQYGHAGQRTLLSVRDGGQVLASQPVTLIADGDTQSVPVMFNAGPAGIKSLAFSLTPPAGETANAAQSLTRVLNVAAATLRVLYIEGEPRWDYKFIRRAEARDPQVQLVSMLRATENKLYRQGISDPSELAQGFPSRAEDLFRYQALIIGSVQAAYFTPVQQDLIEAFADRRGGGVLFLAGDQAFADGGWGASALAPLLPVVLPQRRNTFVRADLSSNSGDPAKAQAHAELAPAGRDSIVTRLLDDPAANAAKWQKLPWLMDYQDVGTPKPGASVLANLRTPQGQSLPLLVTEEYGHGRTAVLASSGTWRWQMMLPLGDPTHAVFWQQLLRWL
ncbi:MAG: glutamine amidotransferase, partial [Terriglobales bacterium]